MPSDVWPAHLRARGVSCERAFAGVHAMSTIASALLVLIGFSGVAAGDATGDLELARALARRGWMDLAEELCDRVGKNPSVDPETKARLPIVRSDVEVEKARREPDP